MEKRAAREFKDHRCRGIRQAVLTVLVSRRAAGDRKLNSGVFRDQIWRQLAVRVFLLRRELLGQDFKPPHSASFTSLKPLPGAVPIVEKI